MPGMTIQISDEMAATLSNLAKATGRTTSCLATEALKHYLDREIWQSAEIQRAVQEADAGDFASDEEVGAVMAKWAGDAR